jgi:peroxiredoxin
MAQTPSTMVALGSTAPDFKLPDTVTDNLVSFTDIKGSIATVVMFISNHCPFVKHVNEELVRLANDYLGRGVGFAAICANDVVNHPQDAPELMKETAQRLQYPFPYCYDETQQTAKAYHAACTPDIFVYDTNWLLVYRGQLDDSRPGNGITPTGKDLRRALDCLLAGEPVPELQRPSIGCNIKWK